MIHLNIYKVLNEIVEYIENNLEEEIKYDVLAKMMGVNVYTMQRIFSLLTNITVSEYIRKRRLSNAGFDLYNSSIRVMDVAIKYQYDNATSFSRAFEAFHGIKPSMVNRITKLRNFPKITFDESINIIDSLEYKIVRFDKFELYGIGITTNNKNIGIDAPNFFENTDKKYHNKYGNIKYGMTIYEDETRAECREYFVLYDRQIDDFQKVVIPASNWLIFRINSQCAEDIQNMTHKFYLEFLPSCKYNLRELPELEYYHDNVTDFLVPIY